MDHEITGSFGELQDISNCFHKMLDEMKTSDRIVLTRDQGKIVVNALDELWDDVAEQKGDESDSKPAFMHLKTGKQEVYFQPRAVAMIAVDNTGTALLVMVTGSTLALDPMQWQMSKAFVLGSLDITDLPETHGMVMA